MNKQKEFRFDVRPTATMQRTVKLSRFQLDLYTRCPRCFWLLKRHNIKQPASFPFTLNIAVDYLLKHEFDTYRAEGTMHPIFARHRIQAKLFPDMAKLSIWRNNCKGVRWTHPDGHSLFGAVDDVLEFPDGSLAVVDYKASGAKEAKVYPSYQLQMDVYTFLLQQEGYRTAPRAYFAYVMAVKDDGFQGRLPFRDEVLEVTPQPARVPELFDEAVRVAVADAAPTAGHACDLCRWHAEALPQL